MKKYNSRWSIIFHFQKKIKNKKKKETKKEKKQKKEKKKAIQLREGCHKSRSRKAEKARAYTIVMYHLMLRTL